MNLPKKDEVNYFSREAPCDPSAWGERGTGERRRRRSDERPKEREEREGGKGKKTKRLFPSPPPPPPSLLQSVFSAARSNVNTRTKERVVRPKDPQDTTSTLLCGGKAFWLHFVRKRRKRRVVKKGNREERPRGRACIENKTNH